MNYFNHKNVQLAYEAVYNQKLCESMEDLGLIDGYDYLEEGIPASNTDPRVTGNPSDKLDPPASVKRTTKPLPSSGPLAIINRPQRGDNFLGPTVTAGGSRYGVPNPNLNFKRPEPYVRGESYDLYDTILEYLIQEGYADTLGSAEIILENMSDEWLDELVEEATYELVKDKKGKWKKNKKGYGLNISDPVKKPGTEVPPPIIGGLSRFMIKKLEGRLLGSKPVLPQASSSRAHRGRAISGNR